MNTLQHVPDKHDHPAEKTGLIRNLSFANLVALFLLAVLAWVIILTRSGFVIAGFWLIITGAVLIAKINLNRHTKLIEIWSELSRQTGLEFERGHVYWIGSSDPPSVSGLYRHRRVSISKVVINIGDYEGTVPVVFTRITLQVDNSHTRLLDIRSKPFLLSLLRDGGSGNRYFDKHFKCKRYPDEFIQQIARWVSQQPALWERPDGVFMLSDHFLSAVNWSPPTIHIEDCLLTYTQSGVISNVPMQVHILNLLCDLAYLVEDADDEQRYDG